MTNERSFETDRGTVARVRNARERLVDSRAGTESMTALNPTSHLAPQGIIAHLQILCQRIKERFPESGLNRIAGQMLTLSSEAEHRAAEIAAPRIGLRVAVSVLAGTLVIVMLLAIGKARLPATPFTVTQLVEILDASFNVIVLLGGALLFLVTVERRLKRRSALAAIHELRMLAHVVDMLQLTKDPHRVIRPAYANTAASPRVEMTAFELSRYLDYCSELSSLIAKLAALYLANSDDEAVIAAVSDVETLTTGLSRKVWQKLMILHTGAPGIAGPVREQESDSLAEGASGS